MKLLSVEGSGYAIFRLTTDTFRAFSKFSRDEFMTVSKIFLSRLEGESLDTGRRSQLESA